MMKPHTSLPSITAKHQESIPNFLSRKHTTQQHLEVYTWSCSQDSAKRTAQYLALSMQHQTQDRERWGVGAGKAFLIICGWVGLCIIIRETK